MSIALALTLGLFVAPEPQTVRAGITWRAPSVCPSSADIERRLRAVIGESQPEQLGGVARVGTSEAGQWQAEISIVVADGHSTRVLRATDCHTLADAYVLMLAVATGRTPSLAEAPARVASRRPLGGEVGAAGIVEAGALPRWTGGGQIHGALTGRWWQAGLAAGYVVPRRVSLGGGAALILQRYEIAAFAGPTLRRRWGSVAITAGLGVGGAITRPRERAVSQQHAPWLAMRSSAHLGIKLTDRLSARLALTGLAALTRLRYRHERSHRALAGTRSWGARATAGLAYNFGPRR